MNLQFIDAGQLRTLLTLETNTPAFDNAGGYQEAWSEVATLWGQIEPLRSGNQSFAQQTIAHVTHLITIRHRTDIQTSMRLRRAARIFTLSGLHDPDDSQRYLICSVREETQ